MWENILVQLSKYDYIEWIILISGLIYAYLGMLNKPICWVFGILSCALLCYKDFTQYNLYFDGILQIFYVLMGLYGLYKWLRMQTDEGDPKVFTLKLLSHLNALILGSLLAVTLVFIMQFFFNPAFVLIDSATTVFSLWATWLLANRVYENWFYWIIIDVVYIYIYFKQGADLVSVLYFFYLLSAIGGLIAWRKDLKANLWYDSNLVKSD